MFCWLFTGERLENGHPIPRFGEIRRCRPPIKLHQQGLHAATDPFDAMVAGRGSLLHFVKAEGVLVSDRAWVASSEQRFLNTVDASALLHGFARFCCRQAEDAWRPSAAVRDYLQTGDGSLAEAARLDAAAAVRSMDRQHPGKAIARTVAQICMGFEACLLAQAAAYNATYALAAGGEGDAWTQLRDAAEAAQRIEFNRIVGVALSLELHNGGIQS